MRPNRPFKYTPNPVPVAPDMPALLDFLRREFVAVYQGQGARWDMEVVTEAPERAYRGMVRYADGTEWDPGGGEGPYYFDGTTWVKL